MRSKAITGGAALAKILAVAAPMLALSLMVGVEAAAQQADAGRPDQAAPIRLRTTTFTPALGEAPAIPPGLAAAEVADGVRGAYIVQFAGPVTASGRDRVRALGAELLDYLPDFAFKTRMTPAAAASVRRLPEVAWVGRFHPAYKLNPNLVRGGSRLYRVKIEAGAELDQVVDVVAATGARVLSRGGNVVVVAAGSAQLDAIARVADVGWIENFLMRERHNEYGAGTTMGADAANAAGYDGSSQTVAIADTGLGDGTEAGAHLDIPDNRITAIFDWPERMNRCNLSSACALAPIANASTNADADRITLVVFIGCLPSWFLCEPATTSYPCGTARPASLLCCRGSRPWGSCCRHNVRPPAWRPCRTIRRLLRRR